MKDQVIVTIGREHGSGGHCIAQMIAEQMHLKLYDKEIVEGIIESSGYSEEFVSRMDEKPVNFLFSRRVGEYSNSLEASVAEKAFELILSKAESGESFVVVGRCAEQVLRDYPNVIRFFVLGDFKTKRSRIMEVHQVSEMKAESIMKTVDHQRKVYHNYYSDIKWGDSRGYDICINSSRLGLEGTSETMIHYIRAFMAQRGIELH